MPSGYVYEYSGGYDWQLSASRFWDTVLYDSTGEEKLVGIHRIDDVWCNVYLCKDGVYRAAMSHCCK